MFRSHNHALVTQSEPTGTLRPTKRPPPCYSRLLPVQSSLLLHSAVVQRLAISTKYASAAFGAALAKSSQTLAKVESDLASVSRLIKNDAGVRGFVHNPTLSPMIVHGPGDYFCVFGCRRKEGCYFRHHQEFVDRFVGEWEVGRIGRSD